MIIQCRKCETRFRFDDTLIEGDGVWVRCSRCQHVFFQQRSVSDAPASEPEIPSVRISDARRNSNDHFLSAGDRLGRVEMQAEAAPSVPIRHERELETDFSGEPSIEGLGADFGKDALVGSVASDVKESMDVEKESLGHFAADDENEDADMAEEESPADGAERTGWGRTFLKLIGLLVFIAVVAGAVYLYLFPEIRNQALTWAAPWLRGIPVLEDLAAPQTKKDGVALVRVKDVRQRSVANLLTGNLRVIEGVAVNQASYPLARIKVRLVVADAYDVVLGEKIAYCGNLLTDTELGALTEAEIQRELSNPQGSDVSNERIAPNGEIPFMIVFNQEQAGAIKTTIVPAGADRVP